MHCAIAHTIYVHCLGVCLCFFVLNQVRLGVTVRYVLGGGCLPFSIASSLTLLVFYEHNTHS